MVKMNIKDLDRNITAEEMKELEAAEKMMPMYDGDSPEMTADMLQQFKRMHQVSRNSFFLSYDRINDKINDEINDEINIKNCVP